MKMTMIYPKAIQAVQRYCLVALKSTSERCEQEAVPASVVDTEASRHSAFPIQKIKFQIGTRRLFFSLRVKITVILLQPQCLHFSTQISQD